MTLKNGKVQDNNYLKFLSQHIAVNGKEKLLPNDSLY